MWAPTERGVKSEFVIFHLSGLKVGLSEPATGRKARLWVSGWCRVYGFRRVALRCLLDAQEEAPNRPWTQAGGVRKRSGLERKRSQVSS